MFRENKIDEDRRTLLKIYHSQVQTHAGYLIAVIIGFLTLVSRWSDFLKYQNTTIIFYGLLSVIMAVSFFIIARISYWTMYGNTILRIAEADIENFCEFYKDEYKKMNFTPNCIFALQLCIEKYFQCHYHSKQWSINYKLTLLISSHRVLSVTIFSCIIFGIILAISHLL